MSKEETSVLGCFGFYFVAIAVTVVGVLLNGWALSILWGWFIVPPFGAPSLTLVEAIGIAIPVNYLLNKHKVEIDTNVDIFDYLAKAVASSIGFPALAVAFGWVVSLLL